MKTKPRTVPFALVPLSLLPLALAVTQVQAGDDQLQERILKLEQELQALKSAYQQSEPARSNAPAAKPTSPTGGTGGLMLNNATTFKYGGFVKFDAITSDYSDGEGATSPLGEDFFIPSTIPVGGSGDRRTDFSAKESRFFFTTVTDAGDAGTIDTRVELDFQVSGQGDERVSNSESSRIRHAYVNWAYAPGKSLLAGQSWSTFFNVAALPDLLDFIGPVATIFERQAQVRWTSGPLQLAVENPYSSLSNGDFDDGDVPDIVARYNGSTGDFSWSAAALLRELTYESDGLDESERALAVSLAGKWQLGSDDLRLMLNTGKGLGRYLGVNAFKDGVVGSDGSLEALDVTGALVAYRHFWTPKLRSSLSLSMATADNPDDLGLSDNLPKAYRSLHANLIYSPASGLDIGIEYLHAEKELENFSGTLADDKGSLDRVQASVKYGF